MKQNTPHRLCEFDMIGKRKVIADILSPLPRISSITIAQLLMLRLVDDNLLGILGPVAPLLLMQS